jgi:adenylate cyclase
MEPISPSMGRAAEAIPQIETALRLSPRDPELSSFEFNMCSAYTHLAQWEKTVEWCKRSIATRPSLWLPYMHLAAANGWLGRDAEAKTAVADLLKLRPGFTVQQFANMKWSDNPQYQRERADRRRSAQGGGAGGGQEGGLVGRAPASMLEEGYGARMGRARSAL